MIGFGCPVFFYFFKHEFKTNFRDSYLGVQFDEKTVLFIVPPDNRFMFYSTKQFPLAWCDGIELHFFYRSGFEWLATWFRCTNRENSIRHNLKFFISRTTLKPFCKIYDTTHAPAWWLAMREHVYPNLNNANISLRCLLCGEYCWR